MSTQNDPQNTPNTHPRPRPLEGKVAFITGAARGMGRSHALRLARDGASIIAVDSCVEMKTVDFYPMGTREDLAETVRLVEAEGGQIHAAVADVRDVPALQAAVDEGVARFGSLDVVVANAGIFTLSAKTHEVAEEQWQELMDVNVTGVWHTWKVAAEHMIKSGPGGSVIIISSLAGFKGIGNIGAYSTTKHAVVGLMRVLANEVGHHGIRVNTIHPNSVATPMVKNDTLYKVFRPDLENPTEQDAEKAFGGMNPFGKTWIEPEHISNAVAWLASDESYYVSGARIPVDAAAAVR